MTNLCCSCLLDRDLDAVHSNMAGWAGLVQCGIDDNTFLVIHSECHIERMER